MEWRKGLFVLLFAINCNGQLSFPSDMLFGAATAAYQIEGAWNISDKGPNCYDHAFHENPSLVKDFSNGDVACDSYHLYKRDVQMLTELGVDFYRFSISWSRVLPSGFADKVSEDGIRYYNDLIDELLENGIRPFVTMYHWDLPQPLLQLGGWTNPLTADYFVDYARVLFENFGDRVSVWYTFNEPISFCHFAYDSASNPPYIVFQGIPEYMCSHTVVMAHGKTYRMYEKEFKDKYPAKIGLTDHCVYLEPMDEDDDELRELTDAAISFYCESHIEPLITGDFPEVMKANIAKRSEEQGYQRSRLPVFTPEESAIVKGTADFVGVNHYTTYLLRRATAEDDIPIPSLADDWGYLMREKDPTWETTASSWLTVNPQGIRDFLKRIKTKYNNPEILISENGLSTTGLTLQDDQRVDYYRRYLESILLSIHEDGCNVTAYTAWSLMDNFEWTSGYTEKFGLFEVDFDSSEKTRTPRKSAYVYKNILSTKAIDYSYDPDMSLPLNSQL